MLVAEQGQQHFRIEKAAAVEQRKDEIGGGPDCLTFDADGTIWATLRWTGRVASIDPRSGVARVSRVGRSPHGILFAPAAMA